MKINVAVLGCGNMAQAIVCGIAKNYPNIDFHTYTPSFTRAEELSKKVKGVAWKKISEIPSCDFYLLACKPQQIDKLSDELKEFLPQDSVLISILAGVTINSLQKGMRQAKVVRVMPNTPSLIGAGVHAIYFSDEVSLSEKEIVHQLFHSIGDVFVFDEEDKIDIVTGFSGSGPAYLFEIGRIMTDKLVSMGIDSTQAERMIKATLFGSAKLMNESRETPETLRNNVTSKKGVTFEALEVFKEEKLQSIFNNALDAAFSRSKELAKGKS